MKNTDKVILDNKIDIENNHTPFGKRWGGQVISITNDDIENLKNGKLIGLDIQNEYIVYLQFKNIEK